MNAVDHEAAAQAAAERRLAACNAQLFEDDLDAPPVDPDDEPIAPFCGCDTCIVREILHAAWPHLLELARDEVRHKESIG